MFAEGELRRGRSTIFGGQSVDHVGKISAPLARSPSAVSYKRDLIPLTIPHLVILGMELSTGRFPMSKDQLFVERRLQRDYAVGRGNAARPSPVLSTQAEAIARAKKLSPKGTPLVERVRNTDVGRRDKWRTP
jgi:hypothetical protein